MSVRERLLHGDEAGCGSVADEGESSKINHVNLFVHHYPDDVCATYP